MWDCWPIISYLYNGDFDILGSATQSIKGIAYTIQELRYKADKQPIQSGE